MPFIERRFRVLFSAMLASFILFGATVSIVGATLPRIFADFNWGYLGTGIVLAAGSVGYFVAAFVSGILVQRLGPKLVLVVGLGLQAAGLACFAVWPPVALNAVLYFIVGWGQGCTELCINFSVVRMDRGGSGRPMGLMHAAFTAGAIVGALAAGQLLAAGSAWQWTYRAMALVSALIALGLWAVPFHRLHESVSAVAAAAQPKALALVRHPLLILSFLILLVYVGGELGVSNWLPKYYVSVLHTSAATGALMLAVFWTGLLLGRLYVAGYAGRRLPTLLFLMAVTCTLALLFALLTGNPWLAGAGFFLTGLGYSAIYPVVMALIGRHFEHGAGVGVGFAAMGGGIGSFAVPFIMAAIADAFGLAAGFLFYVALNVALAALTAGVLWQVRRMPPAPAENHELAA